MTDERRRLSFGGGMLIYITVMLTLIFVALAVWWHYLSCFEAARYEGVMDAYMTEVLEQELTNEMAQYASDRATGYQTASEIMSVLADALGSDAWHYDSQEGTEPPVFTLYCGEIAVGEATMTAGKSTALSMGYSAWSTPDATFDFSQFGRTVKVSAPYGCTVYLCGEPVSEDLVTGTMGLYPQLEEHEALIPQPNQLLVYEIGETFADVAVEYSKGYTMRKGQEADVYYAMPTCEDNMAEQLIDYCKSFVRAYVDYSANLTSLWALQQFLVTDSALYNEVTAQSENMAWSEGVNAVVQTVEIRNFAYYGNVITCDASYITTRDDGDRSEMMSILLVNTDIGWRVIHINVG